ncbi:MAG: low specificity L-threonine aldolase [Proteobacteria bacterium]|nr:low specificity L-threonine aldolase [Pseudomonadota bacterium]
MNFSSDNVTPVCEPILAAVQAANVDTVSSYGGDPLTQRLGRVFCELFEREVAVFPVATGTAANALSLSQLAPPYGGIYCHENAHIVTDECGAPEFFTGGAKLLGLPGADGRIRAGQIAAGVAFAQDMGVHHVRPAAVSLTQATEWGTVYPRPLIAEIAATAHAAGLGVHMDGARFANALAHLDCSPAEATWKQGVDVLSFGATKNGALCAEAVVFFDPAKALEFGQRRKRAGHLWSKMRFISAQLLAYLQDDLWLRNARNANQMAGRLGAGLAAIRGVRLLQPVEANEIFAALPESMVVALEKQGFGFYRWPLSAVQDATPIRLVTSWATRANEVEALLAAAGKLA